MQFECIEKHIFSGISNYFRLFLTDALTPLHLNMRSILTKCQPLLVEEFLLGWANILLYTWLFLWISRVSPRETFHFNMWLFIVMKTIKKKNWIKPSQISPPSPKSRKYLYAKYMAYTVFPQFEFCLCLIYTAGDPSQEVVWVLRHHNRGCQETKLLPEWNNPQTSRSGEFLLFSFSLIYISSLWYISSFFRFLYSFLSWC